MLYASNYEYEGKKMMHLLCVFFSRNSRMVIILFLDNARPHVARMTLQKFFDFEYETFPQPSYSPAVFPTDYHFFKLVDAFLHPKRFRFKGEVETTFKVF